MTSRPADREQPRAVERTPHHLSFDITGAPLALSLAVAFETPIFGHRAAKAWSVKDGRMVLYWTESDLEGVYPLPAPMGLESAVVFVESWLSTVDYGHSPDTDGSVEKSSRVYCEQWGRIDGDWHSFVAIEPEWLIYGK